MKRPTMNILIAPGTAAFRKVRRFASSIFIYQSITSVFYLFERSFVIRNYGAETLTYYSVPLMLGIYLHGVIGSFSQVAIPKLNESNARLSDLLALYKIFTRIVFSLAVYFALMYFCLGHQFLSVWLGSDFAEHSYRLLIIHGVAYATIAISMVCWILAEASHRSGINALSSTATSLIGIVVAIVFVVTLGPESAAIGRLIGAAAVLPLISFLEANVFGEVQLGFWLTTLARISVAVGGVLFARLLFNWINIDSWPALIVSGGVLAVLYWGILFFTGFLNLGKMREVLSSVDGDEMQT